MSKQYFIYENGQPMALPLLYTNGGYKKGMTVEDRFERLLMPEPNSGCWLWIGAIRQSGYGVFVLEGSNVPAHRASYQMFNGRIPEHQVVCHRCDVKICVNPQHLFLGTQRENVHDAIRKGIFAYKPRTLTESDAARARFLRRKGQSFASIARTFGVGETTIKRYIKNTHHGRVVQ